jgi:hypothetical protein
VGWKGNPEGLSGDPWPVRGILISATPHEVFETPLSVGWEPAHERPSGA